jgi:hypothetical protein
MPILIEEQERNVLDLLWRPRAPVVPQPAIIDEQMGPSFYVHWTGVLVPMTTKSIGSYTLASPASGYAPFTTWCLDPVAQAQYDAPEFDQGFVSTVSALADIGFSQGPGGSGSPNVVFQIDSAGADHSYSGVYKTWTGGTVTARFLRFRLLQITGSDPVFITRFTPQLNNAQVQDSQANVTILVGGTQIFFGRTFHSPPSVTVTPVSSSALIGTGYNVLATSCFVKIFNTSGTDVGGIANVTETGF